MTQKANDRIAAMDAAPHVEGELDAVGSGMYHLVPIDREFEKRLDDMQEEV